MRKTDPIMVEIDLVMWQRNHQALVDARDNVRELSGSHISEFGVDTKKYNAVMRMYDMELEELDALIDYSKENRGATF